MGYTLHGHVFLMSRKFVCDTTNHGGGGGNNSSFINTCKQHQDSRLENKQRCAFILLYHILYLYVFSFYHLNCVSAVFLLPYIIMTLILGLPLFFMELSLGQFTSQGPVTSWGMNPLLSGRNTIRCWS